MFVALALLLSAAPDTSSSIRVMAPALNATHVEPDLASFFTTTLAQRLTRQGLSMMTNADIAATLGLERQRQLMGCADDVCRANVTEGFDVDALLTGQIAKLDKGFVLEVRLLEPGSAKLLASGTAKAETSDRLEQALEPLSAQLAQQLARTLNRSLTPNQDGSTTTRWSTVKKLGFVPLGLGVASLAAGVVGLLLARDSYTMLINADASNPLLPDAVNRTVTAGKLQQTLGWTGVGVGVGLAALAAAMFIFGGDDVVSVAGWLDPRGGFVALTGGW